MDVSSRVVAFARQNTTVFLCLALLATWLLLLGILLICQLIGAPFSMNIHATGEDRVWTDLLDKGGFNTHRSWWALASRNPLGPWWYDAITPLLSLHPSGLYLSKRFVELLLALACALVFFEVLDRKRIGLSYGLGVLVLVWNFSSYIEQILFVMLIALAFSLFSLYAYLRYLKTQRSVVEWLLLSLAAYFIALGTYTIQCGVPLAVLIISLAYGSQALNVGSRLTAWYRSWLDASYFGVVFVLFTMIWITTSGPTSSYFKVNARLILQNAWTSIANMVWHQDTVDLTRSLTQNWSSASLAIVFAFSLALVAYVLRLIAKYEANRGSHESSFPSQWNPTVMLFAIALSIAIPTFALEAMSTIWYPGSRSRMIQQAFQPILYTALLYGIVSYVGSLRRIPFLVEASLVIMIAFGTLVSFEYNRKLVELSSYERNLVAGLKALVPEVVRTTKFVVRLDNDDWYGGRNTELNRILMKQSYDSDLVSLDALYKGAADPTIALKISEDETGVFCPSAHQYVPYEDVVFASFDGKNVTRLPEVDSSTFSGFQVVYERKAGFSADRLASVRPTGERVEFQFDSNPPGAGWSVPESSSTGESFVWMSNKTASYEFYRPAETPCQVRFKTLQPISPEIRESMQLKVQGKFVPLHVVDTTDNKWIFEASLPPVNSDGPAVLEFVVTRTMPPPGASRELAVPFDWIQIEHIANDSEHVSMQSDEPITR